MTTSVQRAPMIAVIGGATADDATCIQAERVGQELARAGAVMVCGGRGGVMEAACRGASRGGGVTIGILPGGSKEAANAYVQIAITTGLGEARNAVIAHAADALIAVGGRFGTLSEIALGLTLGKRVVSLDSWDLGSRGGDLRFADSPRKAVELALEAL